jgi:lipoprotein-releasing system permease protein
MFRRVEFQIAWRYLGAQRKSLLISLISLLSILGVGIGSAVLIIALSAANGFEDEVTQQMMGKEAHLEVVRYHYEPVQDYEKLYSKLKKNEDLISVSPFIMTKAGISSKTTSDGIVVYGIDAEASAEVLELKNQIKYGYYNLDSLHDTTSTKRPTVILGNSLANRLRVILGDKIVLQTFSSPEEMAYGGGGRMIQCLVSGIFESGSYDYDASLAYVSIESAQKLLGYTPNEVSGFQATIEDPWQSDVIADKVEEELKYPYYAMDWKAKNANLIKWMSFEKVLILVILCMIIVVAAFNIISSLIMLVLEKTREIGILRAMGASSGSILRTFILTGGFIGFGGTVGGVLLGLGVCYSQIYFEWFELPGDVYLISVFPIKVIWTDVITVFIVGNVISLLATIPPAFKASRLDPVKAIRHE